MNQEDGITSYSGSAATVVSLCLGALGIMLGAYGLVLFFTYIPVMLQPLVDVPNITSLKFLSAVAAPFRPMPTLARFVIMLVTLAVFAGFLSAGSRSLRNLNAVAGSLVVVVLPYAYAGVVFLVTVVLGIRWTMETYLLGRILFSIGLAVPVYVVVAFGLKVLKLRFLLAFAYAVACIPAQAIILLTIFQFIPPTLWLAIGGILLLGLNLFIYQSSMK